VTAHPTCDTSSILPTIAPLDPVDGICSDDFAAKAGKAMVYDASSAVRKDQG
jgi:hypothetical protein